jgi:hypothetical protein
MDPALFREPFLEHIGNFIHGRLGPAGDAGVKRGGVDDFVCGWFS